MSHAKLNCVPRVLCRHNRIGDVGSKRLSKAIKAGGHLHSSSFNGKLQKGITSCSFQWSPGPSFVGAVGSAGLEASHTPRKLWCGC